jgi:hypothetical protein
MPEAGIEIGYKMASLNIGYRQGMDEHPLHAGLEVCMGNMIVGYAFLPGVYLDSTHRFTLSFRYSNPSPENRSDFGENILVVTPPPPEFSQKANAENTDVVDEKAKKKQKKHSNAFESLQDQGRPWYKKFF